MSRIQANIYYLLLFLTAVLAMMPLAQFIHPLKYDMIDQAYPWRYFIGQCLQEGILPLWNPYQLLGSPIHADPQSSAWYPVTWFFGYISGYNIYTISIDFLLHIFLAGTGMFYLARKLDLRNETAFLMGISYMLSGFFIGNAQHFMWIISGTWIPFILGAFLQLRKEPSLFSAIRLGLPFFMIMTGGYPAFIFLTLYLLLLIFILFVYEDLRGKDYRRLRHFVAFLCISAVFTILAGMVVITSIYHLPSAMTRGSGVTLAQALFGAFTPQSFISFILPFASVRDMEFYNTDLSMSNSYFGLIILVFFITGLMMRKTRLINLLLAWGLFCLAASVGSALPLREFLYHYVPFMNLFRFPALFRLFFILSFIVVSGFAFNNWLKDGGIYSRRIKISLISVSLIITAFMAYALVHGNLDFADFLQNQLFIFSEESRIVQHILFQGLLQLIILIIFFLLITKWRNAKYMLAGFIILCGIDMVMASRLNGPYTLYTQRFKSVDIYEHAKHFPDGFPPPGTNPVMENKDTKGLAFQALWRNLNIFHKQVSYEGYNPLHLKGFEDLADNHPALFVTILQNPLVYLANKVSPLDSLMIHEAAHDYDRKRVYFEKEEYNSLSVVGCRLSTDDTVMVSGFSPMEIKVVSRTNDRALVNLLQNNYYGWRATIDGEPAKIYTGNMSFLSVVVPAGEHEVVFIYDPKWVKTGYWASLIMVIGGLVYMVLGVIRSRYPWGVRK
jgi:hypothetical protein